MITFIALILSVILQIIAFVSALWLIRYAKNRLTWIFISIALVFMAIRRVYDLVRLRGGTLDESYVLFDHWLGTMRVRPSSTALSASLASGATFTNHCLEMMGSTTSLQR